MNRTTFFISVTCAIALLASCESILGIEDAEIDPLASGGNGAGNGGGPTGGGGQPNPDCQSYCDDVIDNCQNEYLQYTGDAVCMGVCQAFPLTPEIGNTIACRAKNAREAASDMLGPITECEGAGPGSDGQCGNNCESWCILFESLCKTPFFDGVYGNQAQCKADCAANIPDINEPFSSMIHTMGDHIQCRLYHVTQAVLDSGTHCPHAAGLMDPCLAMGTGGAGGAGGAGGN